MMRAFRLAALAALCLLGAILDAHADRFELRIGSNLPKGLSPNIGSISAFFVSEVGRRVKEETSHQIEFEEIFGGKILGQAATNSISASAQA